MEDVQRHAPKVPINIDRVGIRGITVPLLVRDRAQGSRQTVARVDLGVDLPASFKGTHMSRFIEALEEWNDEINYQSVPPAGHGQGTSGSAPFLCALLLPLFRAQARALVGHQKHHLV